MAKKNKWLLQWKQFLDWSYTTFTTFFCVCVCHTHTLSFSPSQCLKVPLKPSTIWMNEWREPWTLFAWSANVLSFGRRNSHNKADVSLAEREAHKLYSVILKKKKKQIRWYELTWSIQRRWPSHSTNTLSNLNGAREGRKKQGKDIWYQNTPLSAEVGLLFSKACQGHP